METGKKYINKQKIMKNKLSEKLKYLHNKQKE